MILGGFQFHSKRGLSEGREEEMLGSVEILMSGVICGLQNSSALL